MLDQVLIFDTTLRDGEQAPGASMSAEQKLSVARHLATLRVDVIEAGFPAASTGSLEIVQRIAREIDGPIICGLARALRSDIDSVAEALQSAKRRRIHTFISTSPLHMKYKLRMEPHQVLDAIEDSVRYASRLFEDVEWGCEDGTRSDLEFLCRCVDTAIRAGARTINIADTVGYTLPAEFAALVRSLRERVPGMDGATLSVHCHDDLGLATANSLAAVGAGARQIECTINGVGERAGNTPLEEVVMALRTRADMMNVTTGVRTEELSRISRLVSQATGFSVPPNKAVVGSNAFAHESGIHQHGVIAHRQTYEIMTPESIGATDSRLVMGKHSGRHALRKRLQELGVNELSEERVDEIFQRFKAMAESRKWVTDAEIISLAGYRPESAVQGLSLKGLRLETLSDGPCAAHIDLTHEGQIRSATGSGPTWWAATYAAIRRIFPDAPTVAAIRLENRDGGSEPTFLAVVELQGSLATGSATDHDPVFALARACLQAVEITLAATSNRAKASL